MGMMLNCIIPSQIILNRMCDLWLTIGESTKEIIRQVSHTICQPVVAIVKLEC